MIHTSPLSHCTSPAGNRSKAPSAGLLSLVLLALLFCTLPLHADDRAVVHKIAPVYPEMAKRMHITGTVRVVTTVDASGAVTKVEGLGSNKTVTIQINFDN